MRPAVAPALLPLTLPATVAPDPAQTTLQDELGHRLADRTTLPPDGYPTADVCGVRDRDRAAVR